MRVVGGPDPTVSCCVSLGPVFRWKGGILEALNGVPLRIAEDTDGKGIIPPVFIGGKRGPHLYGIYGVLARNYPARSKSYLLSLILIQGATILGIAVSITATVSYLQTHGNSVLRVGGIVLNSGFTGTEVFPSKPTPAAGLSMDKVAMLLFSSFSSTSNTALLPATASS